MKEKAIYFGTATKTAILHDSPHIGMHEYGGSQRTILGPYRTEEEARSAAEETLKGVDPVSYETSTRILTRTIPLHLEEPEALPKVHPTLTEIINVRDNGLYYTGRGPPDIEGLYKGIIENLKTLSNGDFHEEKIERKERIEGAEGTEETEKPPLTLRALIKGNLIWTQGYYGRGFSIGAFYTEEKKEPQIERILHEPNLLRENNINLGTLGNTDTHKHTTTRISLKKIELTKKELTQGTKELEKKLI